MIFHPNQTARIGQEGNGQMRIVTASKYESDSCYPEIYFIALHAAFQSDQRYDLIILYSKGQKLVLPFWKSHAQS